MAKLPALSFLLSLPFALPAGYLGLLTVLSAEPDAPARRPSPTTRFCIVVPAHDEEEGIAATVESLLAVDYPRELFEVLVVADNCSDRTAERARLAGATVLERVDAAKRGKGYALERAFGEILEAARADAVVVVDADTAVSANLLAAFDARLDRSAVALQAEYGVRNPEASWRTRLMTIAFATFHGLRGNARERLGLSAGLRGNGMCFATTLLRDVPHNAYSLVEDVEYGIRLGRAGHRVAHVHEAKVRGDMVATEGASRSQRRRWEEGRSALVKEHAWPLLRDGLLQRNKVLLDLAVDLLIPPLSTLAVGTAVGVAASLAYGAVAGPRRGALAALPWLASGGALGLYVLRGTALSGLGLRGYADLAFAPAYVGWKLVLKATKSANAKGEWVRTERGK